jgi:beta-RFAP synthase
MMTRVLAPSRLHFGLFHVPPSREAHPDQRSFGGLGLMIDKPAVVVTVKRAETWQFEGFLASRAQLFAMRCQQAYGPAPSSAFQVLVEQCPAEHTGLGVGTQLGLAVAKGLDVGLGRLNTTSTELAPRVGRGERSAIGVHGFDLGGVIVELGKLPGEQVSPLFAQVGLPQGWRVVLFMPPVPDSWHGTRERMAFSEAMPGNPRALRELAETAILPSARSGDLRAFGESVHEFNRRAGEPFTAVQGGAYASPVIAELIADLRRLGIHGVGQSSWGPTVFAIVDDSDTALSLVLRFRHRFPVAVARVSGGHRVEMLE